MSEIARQLPEIIRAASASPLGIVALLVATVLIIVCQLFSKTSPVVKLGAFALVCVLYLTTLVWISAQPPGEQKAGDPAVHPSGSGEDSAGKPRVPTGRVKVESTPAGAEVFIDWSLKGRTPLELGSQGMKGVLVLVKDGYEARYQRLSGSESGKLEFDLKNNHVRESRRLLLVQEEGAAAELFQTVRQALADHGYSPLGIEEAGELRVEIGRAGGVSNQALRAWARTRFDADILVTLRSRQSVGQLDQQEFGHPDVRDAVKGIGKVEVRIELEATDLRSGNQIAMVTGNGKSFAQDRVRGVGEATSKAASEAARNLSERVR
jgi:hypothetical protein